MEKAFTRHSLHCFHKNAVGAFHYVWNNKNFSKLINIVLKNAKLSITLIICHIIKIDETVVLIRKFEICRGI